MSTKNLASNLDDDLRPEYDISKLTGGVRGKYYARATAGTTLVLLEPDVAEAFPSGEAVNNALRAPLKIAKVHIITSEAAGKLPNKRLQPTKARQRSTQAKRSRTRLRG